jgi:hypothetical protein
MVPNRAVLIGTVVVLAAGGLFSYLAGRPDRNASGIPRCPAAAADELLSVEALQCWFDAPHGRWRTLSRESHHDVLVVHVEALDARDAEEIARRFVVAESVNFSEILVYTQPELLTVSSRIQRMRWTPDRGFEVLEFAAQ